MANSFSDDDPSLHIQFDGSLNPDYLPDVTSGPHLELSDGSLAMFPKAGSGRMSPIRARSMKDYEQTLADLRKDNFSLKLRIYFLEEKIEKKFTMEGEDLYKAIADENIELKIEVERMKKDLHDKQELLKKASQALDSISAQHQGELAQARDDSLQARHHEVVEQLEEKITALQQDITESHKQLDEAGFENQELVTKNDELLDANRKLETTRRQLMERLEASSDSDESRSVVRSEEQQQVIDEIKSVLKTKELIIEQQEAELKETQEKAKKHVTHLERQLQDLQRFPLREASSNISTEELNEKNIFISNLEANIAAKDLEVVKVKELNDNLSDQMVKLKEQIERSESSQDSQQGSHLQQSIDKMREQINKQNKGLLHDSYRQIEGQEKMIQELLKNLQDKDKQLETYINNMGRASVAERNENIIERLTEQLKNKEQAIQDTIKEKTISLEEKDGEINQLKTSLRERDNDIGRANKMLLNTEETIDTLEAESREKDLTMQQLAESLKALKQQLKENSERHETSVQDRESLIDKLKSSLKTDTEFDDSGDENMLDLQKQIQQKEQLIEELLTSRNKTTNDIELTTKQYEQKLQQKEQQIRLTQESSAKQVSELNHQIQGLLADLNKKDYEIQTVENRATFAEEQQQELIDKLRDSVHEKDKTIKVLLESSGEKDRLFRSIHDKSPDAASVITASKLLELEDAKQEIARLNNLLSNQESLIERLRSAAERRSPRLESFSKYSDSSKQSTELLNESQDPAQALVQSQAMNDQFKQQISSMKRKLEAFGAGGDDTDEAERLQGEVQRLREEVTSLREQLKRPATPTRFTNPIGGATNLQLLTQAAREQLNEYQQMKESLRIEKDIYRQLTNTQKQPASSDAATLELQLQRVELLRTQLVSGIEKNQQLTSALQENQKETQKESQKDDDTSDLNSTQGSQVSPPVNHATHPNRSANRSPALLPKPRLSIETQRGAGPGAGLGDNSTLNISYLPSFTALPDGHSDSDNLVLTLGDKTIDLTQATVQQLHDTIHKLCHDLKAAQSAQKATSTETLNLSLNASSSGYNNTQEQVTTLKTKLKDSEYTRRQAESKLDSLLQNSDSGDENRMIRILKQRLSGLKEQLEQRDQQLLETQSKLDMQNTGNQSGISEIHNEVSRLRKDLTRSENLNQLLKKQLESDSQSSGFNPNLLVKMAQEIEDLKHRLAEYQSKSDLTGKLAMSSLSLSDRDVSRSTGIVSQVNTTLQTQLELSNVHTAQLQSKLSSTEQTVRGQTEKMKYYRNLLETAGLLHPLPKRAYSESSLQGENLSSEHRAKATSNENLSGGEVSPRLSPSGSLAQFVDFGQSDVPDELKDQINQLRNHLTRYSRIIRNLHQRIKHSISDDIPQKVSNEPPTSDVASSHSAKPPLSRTLSEGLGSRLRDEIKGLKQRLEEASEQNSALQKRITMMNSLQSSVPASGGRNKEESLNPTVRRQLADCRGLCTGLSRKMDDLTEYVEEIYPEGGADGGKVTGADGAKVVGMLVDARNVLTYLMMMLDGLENVSADSEDIASTLELVDQNELEMLKLKNKEAESQIRKLNQQIATSAFQNTVGTVAGTIKTMRSTLDHGDGLGDTLDRSLDAAGTSGEGMRQILRLQREKTEMSLRAEHNKTNLEQVEQENARLTTNNTYLEGENLRLKSLLQREKEKCIEMSAEKVRLHDTVEQRDVLNNKLKDSLKDSHNMVEALQKQVDQLTAELNDRSTTVHKLESHLRRHRSLNRNSPDVSGRDSIERERASSQRTDSALHMSTENINGHSRSAHSDVDLLKDASFGSLVEANSQQSAELQKLHEQLKTAEDSNATLRLQVQKLKVENGMSGGMSGGGMDKSLEEHLKEIRQLRIKLEESIAYNDTLRLQLQQQLQKVKSSNGGDSTELPKQLEETREKLKHEEAQRKKSQHLKQQMIAAQVDLDKQKSDLEHKEREIVRMKNMLQKSEHMCDLLKTEKTQLQSQLGKTKQELNVMRVELSDVREQVDENTGLNKTLNLEVAMLHESSKGASGGNIDLQLVLSEIKELRIQLLNTIDNNNRLRKQLEKQLQNGDLDTVDGVDRRAARDVLGNTGDTAQTGSSAFQAGEVYIIADVDDHELLKREIAEGRIVVKTMQSSIKERLRAYTHNTQSTEYNTFKALSSGVDNMKHCIRELERLSALYWTSPSLPHESQISLTSAGGASVNKDLYKQNANLQKELSAIQNKYSKAKTELKSAYDRIKSSNKKKELMEEAVIKQLNKTHNVLIQTRENLEKKQEKS